MKELSDAEKAELQAKVEQERTERTKGEKSRPKNCAIVIGILLVMFLGYPVEEYIRTVLYVKDSWQGIVVRKWVVPGGPWKGVTNCYVKVEHEGNRHRERIPRSIWKSIEVGDRVIKKKGSLKLRVVQIHRKQAHSFYKEMTPTGKVMDWGIVEPTYKGEIGYGNLAWDCFAGRHYPSLYRQR